MIYFAKWKIAMVLGVCLLGLTFLAPNFLSKEAAEGLPDYLPHKQISLGLDLQGGVHLLIEVGVDTVIRERAESVRDDVRVTLRKAKIRYSGLGISGTTVRVTIKDTAKVDQAVSLFQADQAGMEVENNGNAVTLAFTDQALKEQKVGAVEQSVEVLRKRIDALGVREPTIIRQGDERILVQVPGIDDPERLKAIIGKTAKMTFHLVDNRQLAPGRVPPGSMRVPDAQDKYQDGSPVTYLVQKRVMVSGESLIDAQPSFDSRTNEPVVSFRFDTRGARKFGDVTTKNVGVPFAIILDGKVITAPVIREPILGGSGQISGRFTVQETQDLSLLLRAGALPAPLTFLEERTVGPGMGADSIAAGKIAAIIGLIAVIVFMVIGYGRFGGMADVALMMNIILIGAALSVLQATLTLPGIAGVVLTIGMAVDANVLIFERIREEVAVGRTPISAVDAGYSRAITTIIDANVTTLIAAVLLYQFGSGPIRGFAVTLAIGIVTSMFTAIMVTRLMVVTWLRRTKPTKLEI
jgi:preprotein translocase subunit SecD